MSRRSDRLIEHREGEGRLLFEGSASVRVRYVLDRWMEDVSRRRTTFKAKDKEDHHGPPFAYGLQVLGGCHFDIGDVDHVG
jgi:hypothetical protein